MSEKNIICQDHRCVVVIRRGGRSYTKSVAYSRAGGPQGALRKARAWRDQKLAELPPPGRRAGPRRRPLANKQSAQPAGVSEHVSRDGRLRFSVNWKDESGRKRVKVFSAGPAATADSARVRRAERAARRFRKAYEAAVAAGHPFDPDAHA